MKESGEWSTRGLPIMAVKKVELARCFLDGL